MLSKKTIIWISLWILVGIGSILVMHQADDILQSFLEKGDLSIESACQLLPKSIDAFFYDTDFKAHWNLLHPSKLYAACKKSTLIQEICNHWNITDKNWSSFERSILECWGPEFLIAYSSQEQTLYLLYPFGKRKIGTEWWMKMASVSASNTDFQWKVKQFDAIQNFRCIELKGGTLLPSGIQVQLSSLNGVAIFAISPRANPIKTLSLNSQTVESLWQDPLFIQFFKREIAIPHRCFGFMRLPWMRQSASPQDNLGVEWSCSIDKQKTITTDLYFPWSDMHDISDLQPPAEALLSLRQSDDLISMITSKKDFEITWTESSRYLPKIWKETLEAIQPSDLFGTFKNIWDPVLDKLGHDIFMSLGEADLLSEKFKIPIPRFVIAFPFTDSAEFLRALELTVLRGNKEFDTNLVIRKTDGSYGNYYEVRMGDSKWKEKHGLKELPTIAFNHGLVIFTPNTATMEKLLQNLHETNNSISGVNVQLNTRLAPSAIRIVLGALGSLASTDENIFLSPNVTHSMSEIFAIMEQFGDSHLVLTHQKGFSQLHATLKP